MVIVQYGFRCSIKMGFLSSLLLFFGWLDTLSLARKGIQPFMLRILFPLFAYQVLPVACINRVLASLGA